ncbi:hypothetical protein AALO_G00197850 [Alosa alosa]|uniref:Cell adhesion molecule-related/down-regulated by oncogenes n=1 Tax=Alosa alosa TaxID=278164 RepID=A0AAV6G671_9TELE|nr:cell adhesion molecule-related/down-regulated by oncogenes [Alosa alosa]KAG5269061.1 hypothetical protein AALO_G00197850 [Alosa alosa]
MASGLRVLPTVLCLSQALLISCAYSSSLSFISEPTSVVQKQGTAVQLNCSVRPASARVWWLFAGQPLELGALGGVELQHGSLFLPSLQPEHQGSYQCLAQSDAGVIISRYAHVEIADIEEFGHTQRRSLHVTAGSTALIECQLPSSNPPALPRYRVRGKWLEESTDEYLLLPSGNLQIVSITPEHQGMYKCGAFNPITKETRVESHGTKVVVRDEPAPVTVIYPTSPLNVSVEQSKSLTLECVLSGNPSSAVKWTQDGKEVSLGSRRRLLYSNLVLTDVTSADSGTYHCSLQTNRGTVASANYTVNVFETSSLVAGLTDKVSPLNSSVQFTCQVKGNPSPNVTWLFNSNPISPSPRLYMSSSSLVISSVRQHDQGMYQCLLDNGIGSEQSSGRLTVQSGPISPPVILTAPMSTTVLEGGSVTLHCNASGQPLPVIRWHNAAGPIATDPTLLLLLLPQPATAKAPGDGPPHLVMSRPGSSTLHIQAASEAHAGTYSCEASNRLGSVRAEAVLTVDPQPSSTLGMPWETLPSIHPFQSDEGDELFSSLDKVGPGDSMGLPTERTSDQPTPEAPVIISPPQTHKPDIYDLEWKAVKDTDIPINAYFVKYRKVNEMGNVVGSWQTVRVPGSENTLRLNDLEASSLYEVLMVARSTAGDGQPAMLTFRTGKEKTSSSNKNPSKSPSVSVSEKPREDPNTNTHYGVVIPDRAVPEAPDRPTISMATENSVYVTWIPRANGGSPITAFRVEYRKQGRSGEWMIAADNISPLKLSVEVRNLEPGSTHRFRVIAMNMYGDSPHSATSRPYQVSAASPSITNRPVNGPHISSTDAVSDTQIMLRWTYTPSINNNTPIQGFYIYYRPTDSDNDSDYKRDIVEGKVKWHLIGQLQAETSYDIKMQCFNDGGESEFSNVMICETKARQPPGLPSQHPITPPGPDPPEAPATAGGLLSVIVGCVLGVMVLILLAFIAMCLWRNRQQNSMHKYDPPGYLYQPAEMNGHVLEYAALPGSSRINGYSHSTPMLSQGCHHLHHKLPNGLALLNGSGGLYSTNLSHARDNTLPHGTMDYEHSHPNHLHNGGAIYTTLPQADASDCMSCQNFCNNNRCYTKTNGTFSGGTLPLMHRVAPCQQDSLEMVPLSHVAPQCYVNSGSPQLPPHVRSDRPYQLEDDQGNSLPSSQSPPGEQELSATEEREEEPQMEAPEEPAVCWESLADLDCKEKVSFISSSSLTGDLIQPSVQEV